MRLPAFVLACLCMIVYGCMKSGTPPAPVQSTFGHLRYSTTITDGPGLYYEKEFDTTVETPDFAASVLLLTDGHGGAVRDGEKIDSLYHKYLNTRTQLSYRETGKKRCFGSFRAPCINVPIIDTIQFVLAP